MITLGESFLSQAKMEKGVGFGALGLSIFRLGHLKRGEHWIT